MSNNLRQTSHIYPGGDKITVVRRALNWRDLCVRIENLKILVKDKHLWLAKPIRFIYLDKFR